MKMRKNITSINKILVSGLILLSVSSIVFADAGQLLSGFKDENSLENQLDNYDSKKSYLLAGEDKNLSEEVEESAHVSGSVKNNSKGMNNNGHSFSGITAPGAYLNSENYLEFKNKNIVGNVNNKGNSIVEFSYIYDSYSYKDSDNAFKATFEDSKKGHKIGTLHVGGGGYWSKGYVNTGWIFGAGVGWNYGKGIFGVSGERSVVDFQLWTFPIDTLVALEFRTGRYLKLALRIGPSVLGVLQTRSDRTYGEKQKQRRQLGLGYVSVVKLQFNLSAFSSDLGMEMYNNYKISDFHMNLEARIQNYDNFKEEGLAINGSSLGIGFTFEYL